MLDFFRQFGMFFDSQYHTWEAIPAVFLVLTTAWLFVEAGSLAGWPENHTGFLDLEMDQARENAVSDAGKAFVVWLTGIGLSCLLALILSWSGVGLSNSFWIEIIWIVKYALLFLGEIVFVIVAVATLVRAMIGFS